MTEWKKNTFRQEFIQRNGETSGLPLFDALNKAVSKIAQSRFENAPKSIPVANDTKRLHHIAIHVNTALLNANQQIVYDAFKEIGPASNKEVAAYLKDKFVDFDNWDASTVSARNYELRQYGKIISAGKRRCNITGEVVTVWKINEGDRS